MQTIYHKAQAWAFWMLANQSFGGSLVGGWSYDKVSGKMPHKLQGKSDNFVQELVLRLHNVQIECCDALRLIVSRDCVDAFFYLDPPYFQANMGHYGGYTAQHFEELLRTLTTIRQILVEFISERFIGALCRCKSMAERHHGRQYSHPNQ